MVSTAMKTDKYELTMLQAAINNGTANKPAVFELFARNLKGRPYGVVCGTTKAIDTILNFTFTPEEINYLSTFLNEETINYLTNYKFTGTVTGMREGDVFFPYTPILTIEGTFAEGIILETILLSILNYDSAVASTASKVRSLLGENVFVQELGARRINQDAAIEASRAAYLAGFDGTSNLAAGMVYGVPVYGTSAHSWSLAHENETDAFLGQIEALGTNTTLLVDTYDITEGINNAIATAGTNLGAIRLDSGDPLIVIPAARTQLDKLGATNTRIVFSGDLDTEVITNMANAGVPVDGIGIGTSIVTGGGEPNCGFVYKLVAIEYADGKMHPVAKKSASKASNGGKKFVTRTYNTETGNLEGEYVSATPQPMQVNQKNPAVVFIKNGEQIEANTFTLEQAREFHKEILTHNTLFMGK